MALFFTCFVAFLLLHKVPIVGDILVILLFVIALSFVVAMIHEYNAIQVEREVKAQLEHRR